MYHQSPNKIKTHILACKSMIPLGAALITGITALEGKPESNSSLTPVVLLLDTTYPLS